MRWDYIYKAGEKIPISPRGMNDEEAKLYAEKNDRFKKVYEKGLARKAKYEGKIKLGRWMYCKYCYKDIKPVVNWYDGLVECSECDAGLYPLYDQEDIESWIKQHP